MWQISGFLFPEIVITNLANCHKVMDYYARNFAQTYIHKKTMIKRITMLHWMLMQEFYNLVYIGMLRQKKPDWSARVNIGLR